MKSLNSMNERYTGFCKRYFEKNLLFQNFRNLENNGLAVFEGKTFRDGSRISRELKMANNDVTVSY